MTWLGSQTDCEGLGAYAKELGFFLKAVGRFGRVSN